MQPQFIYEGERPVFVVLPYQDYIAMAGDDEELIPFDVADYIANPIKAARIGAGMTQGQLADALGVSQPYVAKVEAASYKPSAKLLQRASAAIHS